MIISEKSLKNPLKWQLIHFVFIFICFCDFWFDFRTVFRQCVIFSFSLILYWICESWLRFQSDIIIVFGNPDIRTAEYASKLWLDGLAEWLMISGKEGTLTKGMVYLYKIWNVRLKISIYKQTILSLTSLTGWLDIESCGPPVGSGVSFDVKIGLYYYIVFSRNWVNMIALGVAGNSYTQTFGGFFWYHIIFACSETEWVFYDLHND